MHSLHIFVYFRRYPSQCSQKQSKNGCLRLLSIWKFT